MSNTLFTTFMLMSSNPGLLFNRRVENAFCSSSLVRLLPFIVSALGVR